MRTNLWLLLLLMVGATPVLGANHNVYIGDDTAGLFAPGVLSIGVGDSVTFGAVDELIDTGPHNVVADDGSFRCARGCDGEGGSGTPSSGWTFTRTFNTPGVINYHDEVSHATGVIVVFEIGPGITGAWYDPAQSGHGLMIEVLPDSRLYVSWFAFNPSGTEQAWFTGVGTYSGRTATITAVDMPTGGRWIPNFDSGKIVHNAWGRLDFTFFDCNHATVHFNSVLGYGSGVMTLTRLTQPAGLSCP